MDIDVKAWQLQNAYWPIDVTESGIDTEVTFVLDNAYEPIIDGPDEKENDVVSVGTYHRINPSELYVVDNWVPRNAFWPINVTEFGMVISFKVEQPLNALKPIDVTDSGMDIELKRRQLVNVYWSINVTKSGMVIDVKVWQLENADWPIDVTDLGMVIDVKAEQLLNADWPIDVSSGYCPYSSNVNVIDVKL